MCTLSSLEAITFKFQEKISNTISEIPSAENSSLESIFSCYCPYIKSLLSTFTIDKAEKKQRNSRQNDRKYCVASHREIAK